MSLQGSWLLLAGLAIAPMQCGSSRDPELRTEDTAGDALWELAQTFEKEGNATARDRTLRYLVERYPSNRHAPAAKEKLDGQATAR